MIKQKELSITDLSYDCLGVSFEGEKTYLIEDALVGETVLAEIDDQNKRVTFGKSSKVISSSNDRTTPICPYYNKCGGCNMMHMAYPATLKVKSKWIKDTMRKIAHLDVGDVEVVGLDDPLRYRNKIQLPVGFDGKVRLGYYKKKSHSVIDIDDCYLSSSNMNKIACDFKNLVRKKKLSIYDEKTNTGIIRHLLIRENELGEVMVCVVANIENDKAIAYFRDAVSELVKDNISIVTVIVDINRKHNNVILGHDSVLLYGNNSLLMTLLGVKYELSYNSFFQVNQESAENLYKKILEFADLKGTETIIDAYSGVGSITLQLAKKAQHVYGIEIIKEAIINANHNKEINQINNVTFIEGKVEDKINELLTDRVDLIVFDPPRKGLDSSIIDMLEKVDIKKIIYVSCNYATLARDLNLLRDTYTLEKIVAVDMFCYCNEVETVVGLYRKD